MNVTEIEKRLEVTEKALNEALKEIELLRCERRNKQKCKFSLRKEISEEVYEALFSFDCDRVTGEKCCADVDRKMGNFKNLCNNILMCLGYTYPLKNTKDDLYYLKVLPAKNIPESDFQKLYDLFHNITTAMYEFKKGK